MQNLQYTLTGVGTYEWNTEGDAYSTLACLPTSTASYYVEVSNGGNVWVDHPGTSGGNPYSGISFNSTEYTFSKARIRAVTNDGSIYIHYRGTNFTR